MSRERVAGRAVLKGDSLPPSPEKVKVNEMFKRVIAVAELLSKSDQVQKQSRLDRTDRAQKTQESEPGVS